MSYESCTSTNPNCLSYGLDNPYGNLFIKMLDTPAPGSSSMGVLPEQNSSLNAKYWKTLYTDRNMDGYRGMSAKDNAASFFNVTTFSDTSNPSGISGNDIYKSLNGGSDSLSFDDNGNLKVGEKIWKNPLTPGKQMDKRIDAIDITKYPNKDMILTDNGKWILIRDLGIKDKYVYYILYNPIHSGEIKGTKSNVNTTSFKQWYLSQINNNGDPRIKGSDSRLYDPILQKYCEITAQKSAGRYKTSLDDKFKAPYDTYPTIQQYDDSADGSRNYADSSCFYVSPKEGVFNRIGGIFNPSSGQATKTMYDEAYKQILCTDAGVSAANNKRPQSFIGDFIRDSLDSRFAGKCPESNINFCTNFLNAAGNINLKDSKIGNECGSPPPTLPPITPPPTQAPTFPPNPISTQAPTIRPTPTPVLATPTPTVLTTPTPTTEITPTNTTFKTIAIASAAIVFVGVIYVKFVKK
jgi:hypothetical protein